MYMIIKILLIFFRVLELSLVARAMLSWFVRDYSSPVARLYEVFVNITEPIVKPCRQLMSRFNTGMFDFSIIVAFLLVGIAQEVIIRILLRF